MHILGIVISVIALLLAGLLMLRGAKTKVFRLFPLFYSYVVYAFCGSLVMYVVYWLDLQTYASAYWIYFLVSFLVEFVVLAEISDQIFRPYPAIRNLGRAVVILVSVGLGIPYVLPVIFDSPNRSSALLAFALRVSITKAVILFVLFYIARHYGSRIGRNIGGLMIGFSIYLALEVATWAAAKVFGPALFASVLWFMGPVAFTICLIVWTVSLWNLDPVPQTSTTVGMAPEAVALRLARFNSELTKILRK